MDIVLRVERLESDLNSSGGSKERKCLKESQQLHEQILTN